MIYLLPHTVAESAARYPDHSAFICNKSSIAYGELYEQANQLAHFLLQEGFQRGDRIGIYLHRSVETAIAVYGIMQAGCVYVPIDPFAPETRVRQILADCDIRVLVSSKNQRKVLTSLDQTPGTLTHIIGVSETFQNLNAVSWEVIKQAQRHSPDIRLLEDDLAYIMYTSGTTGNPKGIMHTHRSGLSYAKLSRELYRVGHEDVLGNHSPLHFDISTMGYFTMPLAGGTTVIVPEMHTKMPASLSQLIEKERLTFWYSVPLALTQLLQMGSLEEKDLSSLRWVLFGGEPFPAKHLRDLMLLLPQTKFCNVYGPAEVNQCTYHHLAEPPKPESEIPLGKVWDNTEIKILDSEDCEVATNETGELLVRTSTMMQGYWGQEALTKRAFSQFEEAGLQKTYYRTGDLVKRDAAGQLMFLGRKDRQVKVRGYRVELNEIETALISHVEVDEGAVYTVKESDQKLSIQAVITWKKGITGDLPSLKKHLQSALPPYAVPERIVETNSIPRTSAGKIDHKQLQKSSS